LVQVKACGRLRSIKAAARRSYTLAGIEAVPTGRGGLINLKTGNPLRA
jgi:hypothetical protein